MLWGKRILDQVRGHSGEGTQAPGSVPGCSPTPSCWDAGPAEHVISDASLPLPLDLEQSGFVTASSKPV